MAIVTSGITLFREKSAAHRAGFGGADSSDEPIISIRSNRVVLSLRAGPINETVIVRGHNIPSTLRMVGLAVDQFNRNPSIFAETSFTHADWAELWKQRLSSYERQFMPESWVTLHHDGECLFATKPSPEVDELERLAQGGDITEGMLREVCRRLHDASDDVMVQHDSQTAVVFTPFNSYIRVAILERRGGRTGSFAVAAHHPPKPKKPVRYTGFIYFCSDLIESLSIKAYLDRVKQMIDENRMAGPNVSPSQVAAAMSRKRDLTQFVVAYERANKIIYRPERPDLF